MDDPYLTVLTGSVVIAAAALLIELVRGRRHDRRLRRMQAETASRALAAYKQRRGAAR